MGKVKIDKEALKKLREERKASIGRARGMIKEQNRIIKAIKAAIKEKDMTIPEIAAAAQLPSADVLMYVATLKKYGFVAEGAKDGDYFKYGMEAAK